MTRYIYGLICPLSKGIKYVGQTKRILHERLKSHIYEYNRNNKALHHSTHKFNWMKKLERENLLDSIEIILIETCELSTVNEREQYWINEYSNLNLVNSSPGGQVHSLETIEKIRQSKLGEKNGMFGKKIFKPKEIGEKISKSQKSSEIFQASRKSKEFRDKLSKAKSRPILLLDKDFNIIQEFPNCGECAEYTGYKKANIKQAASRYRPIGRWQYSVKWVVVKETMTDSIEKIKNNPNNTKYFK